MYNDGFEVKSSYINTDKVTLELFDGRDRFMIIIGKYVDARIRQPITMSLSNGATMTFDAPAWVFLVDDTIPTQKYLIELITKAL